MPIQPERHPPGQPSSATGDPSLDRSIEAGMIHHLDLAMTDFARSRALYVLALEPLGMAAVMDLQREDGRE
jgi:hypothetical protein